MISHLTRGRRFRQWSSLAQVKEGGGSGEGDGSDNQGPLEVGGFLFKRLIERRPDKEQDLLTFRDHLLASSSQEEALKVFLSLLLSLREHVRACVCRCVLVTWAWAWAWAGAKNKGLQYLSCRVLRPTRHHVDMP